MNRTKILLADDHRIFLEGLKNILETAYDVVALAENGQVLIEESLRLKPDVIITDISMPVMNGIEAIRQIRKHGMNPNVIFLTMHNDAFYAKEVLDMGASGFILKHSASSELMNAIEQSLLGNSYISPAILHELTLFYKSDKDSQKSVLGGLSLRQREVLQLLSEGKSAKEVAGILNISTRTVEFHKYSMMNQLEIKTSAELIHFAIKYGIISV